MNNALLPHITLGPTDAQYTVIWLHGLGADGNDFVPMKAQLNLPATLQVRFIFPHAPSRRVTMNQGFVMPAWFDIVSLQPDGEVDVAGFQQAQHWLDSLIQQEVDRGVSTENIVLAGFSQGGAVALYTALQYSHRLAGVMALSTFLPPQASLNIDINQVNADLAIFMAHGEQDPLIPFSWAQQAKQRLSQGNFLMDWHAYPMAHTVCAEEITDIRQWLLAQFTEKNS